MIEKIKYSFKTLKLRVYHPDSLEPSLWEGVRVIKIGGRAFLLQVRNEKLADRILKFFRGEVQPDTPHRIQEISFLLRRLRKFSPVLVLDFPGWRNPRLEIKARAEWLRTLKELDQNLAQRVRKFISGEGKREYLNSHK
ncbi:MAG: hypothetical protein J7L26_07515 [Candidatus Aminicenantes bacterium]|nr:hypothetical protein [Candidatus Aminicenantes bacterium]